MNTAPTVCCVIILNKKGEFLLVKRGREPFIGQWSLIGGVGYIKDELTVEQGVVDEVAGDIGAIPFGIKKQFSINEGSHTVTVFSAEVNEGEVAPAAPYTTEIKWCSLDEAKNLKSLAFSHYDILMKYIG